MVHPRTAAPRDRYAALVNTPAGGWAARRLGLPRPARLRRFEPGAPLLVGPVLVAAVGGSAGDGSADELGGLLRESGADVRTALADVPADVRLGAVVVDARAATTLADLAAVREVLAPAFARSAANGRVVVLGADLCGSAGRGAGSLDVEAAAVAQALEGLVRTVAKEARAGATANLVRAAATTSAAALGSTLLFLASARSAYVSGQVVVVRGVTSASTGSFASGGGRPDLTGQVAVVTGAARGIGAAIADVLAACGAHVIALDVPASGRDLAATANRVRGTALALDLTHPEAPHRLVEHLRERHGGADVVVHNAGITRDRLLVRMDPARWDAVLAVNLAAPMQVTAALVGADGALRPGARIVGVSSTSGLAGNRGQSNYAASKAGVAGWVRTASAHYGDDVRGIRVNAVAPGFIETPMTAAMPTLAREVSRRASSLGQGGLPVDVAETVAWLADPTSAGVRGQVVRVCGQLVVGA